MKRDQNKGKRRGTLKARKRLILAAIKVWEIRRFGRVLQ